jgi:hypothetical protein
MWQRSPCVLTIRSQLTRTVHCVWSTPNNALHIVTSAEKCVTQHDGAVYHESSASQGICCTTLSTC